MPFAPRSGKRGLETMGLSDFVLWACALAGLSCGTAASPDVSAIQSAYEFESANVSTLHDKGLQVLEASCDEPSGGTYLCQVTFLSTADPNQRLYFDVIAVARGNRRWELKSGLCKR